MKPLACLLTSLLFIIALASCDQREALPPPTIKTIAVIPKGTTHSFWNSIHAGAAKAGQEYKHEIIWKGPLKEDDRADQIKVMEDMINRKVSGIVLAPLDAIALVESVNQAKAANIPVVIMDSDLQGDAYDAFVATDNYAAGKMAGEELVRLLGGKGRIIMLRYQENSASTDNRENGFMEVIKKNPGIQVVSADQYGGATTESCYQKSESILAPLKKPDGSLNIDGIFCANESTTFGMLRALQDGGFAGKVKYVGFDSNEKLLQGLNDGQINALVIQNPFKMGYEAVVTMARILHGEPPEPKRIDTGAVVVTKENIAKPEISELLHPPLDKYLK